MSECHTNSLKVPQNIDFEGVVSLSYSDVKEPMLIAIGYSLRARSQGNILCGRSWERVRSAGSGE
jgi:hypothetical protein